MFNDLRDVRSGPAHTGIVLKRAAHRLRCTWYMIFVSLTKACFSVGRTFLWTALPRICVRPRMRANIRHLHRRHAIGCTVGRSQALRRVERGAGFSLRTCVSRRSCPICLSRWYVVLLATVQQEFLEGIRSAYRAIDRDRGGATSRQVDGREEQNYFLPGLYLRWQANLP